MFDLAYEICRRTAFHIIPHCSKPTAGLMTAVNYKMADLSRGAKKGKKRRGENGKNTLWLPSIAPASAPAPHRIKQEGGFGQVNHFLQVVNSQGRQNESDVCVHIKWRHHSNTLPESLAAFLSHSSSKCWIMLDFEVLIRQIHHIISGCCCCWSWVKPLTLLTFVLFERIFYQFHIYKDLTECLCLT